MGLNYYQITKNILEWQINNSGSKSMIALSSQMYSPQKQNGNLNAWNVTHE